MRTQKTTGPDSPAQPGDPRRFESTIRAFEKRDRLQPPPRGAILCTGSSTITLWNDRLPRDLAPLTVISRGFGGSTMADVLFYADRIVLPYAPRAIVLYEGDNDLALGRSIRCVRDQFCTFFSLIHGQLPRARIYVLSVKPSPRRWALWPRMLSLNRQLSQAMERDPRLCFVDTATPMLDERGTVQRQLFRKDGLHLNARGYAIWRKILRRVLLPKELPLEVEVRLAPSHRDSARISRHS